MPDDPASQPLDGAGPLEESPLDSQLSAFLDGELPPAEVELLVRRLERESALRARFGRYALIGEALRTPASTPIGLVSPRFAGRIAVAIEGETVPVAAPAPRARWLRPVVGLSIAAGVAALAIVFVGGQPATPLSATVSPDTAGVDPMPEASYIVPEIDLTEPLMPAARLANYVMAHSEYSSPLGRRNVLSGMLADETGAGDAIPVGFVPDPARQPVDRP